MKKLIGVLLIIGLLLSPVMANTRAKVYSYFGSLLMEAVVLVIKDEINILRAEHGLSARTNQQLLDALEDKHKILEKHDWMN